MISPLTPTIYTLRSFSGVQRAFYILTGSRQTLVHCIAGAAAVIAGLIFCAAIYLALTAYPMERFFHIAYIVSTVLKFSGTAIATAGVGIFGFYFIRDNGRAARRGQDNIPAKAWRGKGPQQAARILAIAVFVFALSGLVSMILPRMP